MRSTGLWAPPKDLQGIYRVESFDVSGSDASTTQVADSVRWVRVGINPPWVATVQRADGTATRLRMKIDDEASTLALFDRSLLEPPTDPLQLERLGDGRIRLSGVFDEAPIQVTLCRAAFVGLANTRSIDETSIDGCFEINIQNRAQCFLCWRLRRCHGPALLIDVDPAMLISANEATYVERNRRFGDCGPDIR